MSASAILSLLGWAGMGALIGAGCGYSFNTWQYWVQVALLVLISLASRNEGWNMGWRACQQCYDKAIESATQRIKGSNDRETERLPQ